MSPDCNYNSEQWYIFASHSRNANGFISDEGFASFLSFESFEEVLNFLYLNYNGAIFNLTPFAFEQVQTENSDLFQVSFCQNFMSQVHSTQY